MENPSSAPPPAPPAMPPDPPPVAAPRSASKRIGSSPAPATRTSPTPSPAGCPPPLRSGLMERSSSSVKAAVDIATARREAIREGEKRKQAQLICVEGRGEAEEGAGKGLMDKSSTAATATAQREAIRKREKRKQAQQAQPAILTAAAVLGLTLFTFWAVKKGWDFTFMFPFLFTFTELDCI